MARRRKREIWTAETARKEVVLWRASGLTMAEHCRQRGIPPKKFYWWRRRLSEQEDRVDDGSMELGWVEAAITGGRPSPAVTLELRHGTRVEVATPHDVDIVWLSRLLRALEDEA
jgi:hypothetical protein